jgi:hypothetical protein
MTDEHSLRLPTSNTCASTSRSKFHSRKAVEGPATDYTNNCVKRFVRSRYCALCPKRVQVNEAGYGWVSRHTWQSWRERYKKNSTRLDVAITNIVSQRPVVPGEKGQYGYVRFVEEKAKKPKKPLKQDSPVPLDLCGASGSTSSSVRNSAPTSGNLVYRESAATNSAPPQSALISVADTLRTATLTSFEESQEGSEWAIRVGDAPPPAWSKKRGLSQEDTLEDDPKRRRVDPG